MIDLKIKAAAVHAAPVYMNKAATLKKVTSLIAQAATEHGTQLLAFPEVFVPGFPYFINAYAPNPHAVAAYAAQSVVILDDLQAVQAACATHKMTVVLGVSERVRGGSTLFNSIVTLDSDGTILGVRRKLQPTWAERYVWGQGSGFTLRTYETGAGYRLGALACWEHTMNNARQALLEAGEHVHVGLWPALDTAQGFEDTANVQIEAMMKNHALTAQVFCLSPCNFVDDSCVEWLTANCGPLDPSKLKKGGGWTAIIHPFCTFVAGPHTGDEEKLVTGELDLGQLSIVKAFVDGTGHFSRPEVFKLAVDKTKRWADEEDVAGPIPYTGTVQEKTS